MEASGDVLLEQRVERLERSNQRFRWLGTLSVLAALAAAVTAIVLAVILSDGSTTNEPANVQPPVAETREAAASEDAVVTPAPAEDPGGQAAIETGELVLTDSTGLARARLGLSESGDPLLELRDEQGNTRASVALESGEPHVTLADADGVERASVAADSVTLSSQEGNERLALVISAEGDADLAISDQDGQRRIVLGARRDIARLGMTAEGNPSQLVAWLGVNANNSPALQFSRPETAEEVRMAISPGSGATMQLGTAENSLLLPDRITTMRANFRQALKELDEAQGDIETLRTYDNLDADSYGETQDTIFRFSTALTINSLATNGIDPASTASNQGRACRAWLLTGTGSSSDCGYRIAE